MCRPFPHTLNSSLVNEGRRKRSRTVDGLGQTTQRGETKQFSMEEVDETEDSRRTNDAKEARRETKARGFDHFDPVEQPHARDSVLEEEEANDQSIPWSKSEGNQSLEEDSNDGGRSYEAEDTSSLITKLSVERNKLQQQMEQLKREMHDVCNELGREIQASKELVHHTNTLKGNIDTLLGVSNDVQEVQHERLSRADHSTAKERSESLDLMDILAGLTSKLERDPSSDNKAQLESALEKVRRAVGQKQEEQTPTVPRHRPSLERGDEELRSLEEIEIEKESNRESLHRQVPSSALLNRASAIVLSYNGIGHFLLSRAVLWTLAAATAAFLLFVPVNQSELLPVS